MDIPRDRHHSAATGRVSKGDHATASAIVQALAGADQPRATGEFTTETPRRQERVNVVSWCLGSSVLLRVLRGEVCRSAPVAGHGCRLGCERVVAGEGVADGQLQVLG